MQFISDTYTRLTTRFGRRKLIVGVIILALLLALLSVVLLKRTEPTPPPEDSTRIVTVASLDTLSLSEGAITALGTVRSQSEARLIAEASGRVTSVTAKLGDTVRAGQILATIENSTERAQVLQAEGVYESARAGAETSNIGSLSADQAYDEAIIQAQNAYRSAFGSSDNVLRNTVDLVFSEPDGTTPGLKIDGQGRAIEINRMRVELEAIFDAWNASVTTLGTRDVKVLLSEAETNTTRLSLLVTTLTTLLADDKALTDAAALTTLRTAFAQARATLNTVLQTLSGARSALTGAETQKEQAKIGGTSGVVSQADAQMKQALGALRLAQARLEKTLVRTPISGKLNSLTLTEGTSVAAGSPVAIISSTGSFEILAYVNEGDARLIAIGSSVQIEHTLTGVITQIGSAIDPVTKKVEVRIGVRDEAQALTNGQSVTLSIETGTGSTTETSTVRLPIVAIKMTPEGSVVFSVDSKQTLVAHPVTLGAIIGDTVVITSPLESTLSFVTDARGLRAGETAKLK